MQRQYEAEIDIGTHTARVVAPKNHNIFSSLAMFLLSLLLALLVEVLALFISTRYIFKLNDVETKNVLLVGCIATLVTYPCLWYIAPHVLSLIPIGYIAYVCIGEGMVILVEAAIYAGLLKTGMKYALLFSFLANALSFLAGLVVF